MSDVHASGLSAVAIAELRTAARTAAEKAYAPYSGFRVGAALLLDDGRVVTGCNVENASYRLTNCAEQVAVGKAVSDGGVVNLRAVAVANLNGAMSSPCGACRQTLWEFGESETWVFYPGEGGVDAEITLGELLPLGFRLGVKV